MSYILAHGCSYTNKNYKPYVDPDVIIDFLFWPELLGIDLNCDVVNLGSNGHGNHRICMETVDYLFAAKEKPKAVFVLLSGWDRHHILGAVNFNPTNELTSLYADIEENKITHDQIELRNVIKGMENYDPSIKESDHIKHLKLKLAFTKYQIEANRHSMTPGSIISSNLRPVEYLYMICDSMNIPLFIMQGLTPTGFYAIGNRISGYIEKLELEGKINGLNLFYYKLFHKILMNNQYFNNIDDREDRPIGWPFFPELGGYYLDHIISRLEKDNNYTYETTPYRISVLDRHPNGNGQMLIKKYFLKEYRDRINE